MSHSEAYRDPPIMVRFFPHPKGSKGGHVRTTQRYGLLRNTPCHCGSGRKFKKCHPEKPSACRCLHKQRTSQTE